MAPRLLKVFWNCVVREEAPHLFINPIARLSHIENLSMAVHPSLIKELTKVLVRFQSLRQLEFIIMGEYDPSWDYFWILDIAMASEHLQKLSLTRGNLGATGKVVVM
ncbi:hypothetical protein MTR_7g105520 [Medicago truncatula]|uniref:Uncharacterized protein n=1 Tax=Medicago truncatula TaxID=3880 RepID=A0A072U378_MEDTR|nr:hypothetical protein MTR_7g105520 [Medicago truncatula]